MKSVKDLFDLTGKVALITGGAGLLGVRHAEAIGEVGGTVLVLDKEIPSDFVLCDNRSQVRYSWEAWPADISSKEQVIKAVSSFVERYRHIDILINNAFVTVGQGNEPYFAPFEDYPLDMWGMALKTNLTGTFLITQAVGRQMVKQGKGVILNIASDVGVISPDHRIYEGMPFNTPLSYSMCKAAIIHMTKWLATYWVGKGIRVNCLTPAGVYAGQSPEFIKRLSNLIPMGRMAQPDEYKAAVVFLVSDASSFMTGANLIIDGGRTCW